MPAPDTVFVGGTVVTADDGFTIAEAVAVSGGRIAAVGTRVRIEGLVGTDTEIVDLAGRTLLPGFIEAHGHPTAEMLMLGPAAVDVRAAVCGTADAVLEKLRAAVADEPSDGWVAAVGWDPLLLPGLPPISRALLTELSPDIPLSVMHNSGHSAFANDAALARAGVDRDTPDPEGSVYVRDAAGELTGEGREVPAAGILMGPSIMAGMDRFDDYLAHELTRVSAAGVTTTGDLAFAPDSYPKIRAYYTEHGLDSAQPAPVRMRTYEISGKRATIDRPDDPEPLASMLRPVGVKVWSDGSPWIGNIETSFAYEDSNATRLAGVHPGHRGCANYTREQLLDICRTYVPQGWQMACHVHGDIAIDTVLDVFEQIAAEFPGTDRRLRMEHCGSITPEQVRRAHALGATISFFVAHIHYYGEMLAGFFGDRADAWTPAGAAADCGMPFSLHNDPPVTPENPLLNMQTAVTRESRSGRVFGAEYAVNVPEAIRAQTIHAAWQLLSEHEVGSIEPGKYADFVVLGDNPLDVDPHRIGDITVVETWIGGRRVRQ